MYACVRAFGGGSFPLPLSPFAHEEAWLRIFEPDLSLIFASADSKR